MPLVEQLLIAIVPVTVATAGTAIYLNRRRSEKLYQRLFGINNDPTDEGYIPDMDRRLDSIDENVRDLNHRRIDDIEERLDDLHDGLASLEENMATDDPDE